MDNDEGDNVNYRDKKNKENNMDDMVVAFLEDYYRVRRKRALVTLFVVLILYLGATFFAFFIGLSPEKIMSKIINDTNFANVTIEVAQKPEVPKEFYNEETGEYTLEGIAELVSPSIVYINAFPKDSARTVISQGSGIILTDNGYIITNAHVINKIDNFDVNIIVKIQNDPTVYKADLVGADFSTDLAVLKIAATNLPVPQYGDSTELVLGEKVVAIGSPAGLIGTVTQGVVSGLNRMIRAESGTVEMPCIQTDTAINSGNSGGALINMYGQIVGITSSKLSSEKYEGLGFAIAFNSAKPILEDLIAKGYSEKKIRIGITFYEISPEAAFSNKLVAGLQVIEIDPTCDVANCGLQIGDIITHSQGEKVSSKDQLIAILTGKQPGDFVEITVDRFDEDGNKSTHTFNFRLMQDTTSLID